MLLVPPLLLMLPKNVLFSVRVHPISALCRLCAVVLAIGALTSDFNVIACCAINMAAPPGILSICGDNDGALLLPQPLPPVVTGGTTSTWN